MLGAHWFAWGRREASRLRWSFLAHWHSTQAKRVGATLEHRRIHLRALLWCNAKMKGRPLGYHPGEDHP